MSDTYLIDANVLIEAANKYYQFSFRTGFWEWMASKTSLGVIRTASLVVGEVVHPPELVEWVGERGVTWPVDVSDPVIQIKFSEIAEWVMREHFSTAHRDRFLAGADPWIVAVASVNSWVVVTQETMAGTGTMKIKIPNVCSQFGVRCCSTFAMLAELGATF